MTVRQSGQWDCVTVWQCDCVTVWVKDWSSLYDKSVLLVSVCWLHVIEEGRFDIQRFFCCDCLEEVKNNQWASRQTSLVPELENHPLDLVSAFCHWISVVKLKDGQSLNAKCGAVNGTNSISRSTCYQDNKKICSFLKLSPISEKLCKSLGTR